MGKVKQYGGELWLNCPGCGFDHKVIIDGSRGWTWNGSLDAPTIKPSILVTWDHGPNREPRCCHSFVTDGKIKFLADCTHQLAGQIVELKEYKD